MENKAEILKKSTYIPDDVLIGGFLYQNGVELLQANMYRITTYTEWVRKRDHIPAGTYHFRARSHDCPRHASHSYEDEFKILSELVEKFY